MTTIDNRIVSMTFNNKQFEAGVKETLASLSKLKDGLNFDKVRSGLSSILNIGQNFSMDKMATGVQELTNKFDALGIVGMTVIQTLTRSAMAMGQKLFGFILDPLIAGGRSRAEAIEQAKFQFEGLGMDIEKTMASALAAVKGTAYGLQEAALVAAQLGASGMRAGTEMTKSLRAVAGVAAMTGSSYADIGGIFVTVAGNGRLMGDQLRQLSYKGINAAATLGKYLHKSESEIRKMVTKGQIDFKTFAAAMDSAFGKHAQDANKLFSGALANMRAALSRIGADVWTAKLRDYRDILNALTPVIDLVHEKLAPLIKAFNEFHTEVSQGIVTALNKFLEFAKASLFLELVFGSLQYIFARFRDILGVIREAYIKVFPPKTGEEIMKVVTSIHDFILSGGEMKKVLAYISHGALMFFTAIKFVIEVAKTLAQCIWNLVEGFGPLAKKIFAGLDSLTQFATKSMNAATGIGIFNAAIEGTAIIGEKLKKFFSGFTQVLPFIVNLAKKAADFFQDLFGNITGGLSGLDAEQFVKLLNGTIFGTILLNFSRLLWNLADVVKGQGIFEHFTGLLDGIKDSLSAWQYELKGKMLLQLAGAVAILAVALMIMASIDPGRLTASTVAMGALFAELGATFLLMEKFSPNNLKTIVAVPTIFISMAVAVLILAAAMKIFASMDVGQLAKGIVTIAILSAVLVVSANMMDRSARRFKKAAPGFMLFAGAIYILGKAMKQIGDLNIWVITKALIAIAALTAEMVLFSKATSRGLNVRTSVAVAALGGALLILAKAIKVFGSMDLEQLGIGLGAIGVLLLELAIFSRIAGKAKHIIKTAAAMAILAGALKIMANVVQIFAGMSLVEIATGLGVMAAALLISAVALRFMRKALPGAVTMLLLASALAILAPILLIFSKMSLGGILKSLGMLVGIFVIFGAAAAILTPVIPSMFALAGAIALLGVGCVLTGAGLIAVAAGITALAAAGTVGVTALVVIISAIIGTIPLFFKNLGLGIIEFINVLADSGDALVKGLSKILISILDALLLAVPKAIELVATVLEKGLEFIVSFTPKLVQAGFDILMSFLRGIADNIGEVTKTAIDIVLNFIDAIADKLPDIIDAGFNFVISFINGVADSIRKNNKKVIKAVGNLFDAIIDAIWEWIEAGGTALGDVGKGIVDGIIAGIDKALPGVGPVAKRIGNSILNGVKKVLGIQSPSKEFKKVGKYSVLGLVEGIRQFGSKAITEAENVGSAMLMALTTASALAESDVNTSPVITPVLDLSGVKAEAKNLNKTLGTTPTIGVQTSRARTQGIQLGQTLPAEANSQNGSAIEYSFVQNNYSPKALSRLDIYRQTKNQFSAMKGMVSG